MRDPVGFGPGGRAVGGGGGRWWMVTFFNRWPTMRGRARLPVARVSVRESKRPGGKG